jgi:hypothetical protein
MRLGFPVVSGPIELDLLNFDVFEADCFEQLEMLPRGEAL